MVMFTVSLVAVQTPLLIVQAKTYVPGIIPVTVVLSLVESEIAGTFGPFTKDHNPDPVVAALQPSERCQHCRDFDRDLHLQQSEDHI